MGTIHSPESLHGTSEVFGVSPSWVTWVEAFDSHSHMSPPSKCNQSNHHAFYSYVQILDLKIKGNEIFALSLAVLGTTERESPSPKLTQHTRARTTRRVMDRGTGVGTRIKISNGREGRDSRDDGTADPNPRSVASFSWPGS